MENPFLFGHCFEHSVYSVSSIQCHTSHAHSVVIPIKFKSVKNDNKCIWLGCNDWLVIGYRLHAIQLTRIPKSSDDIFCLWIVTMIVGIVLCMLGGFTMHFVMSCIMISRVCVCVWNGVPCWLESLYGNQHRNTQTCTIQCHNHNNGIMHRCTMQSILLYDIKYNPLSVFSKSMWMPYEFPMTCQSGNAFYIRKIINDCWTSACNRFMQNKLNYVHRQQAVILISSAAFNVWPTI